jgi:hypothetical protein
MEKATETVRNDPQLRGGGQHGQSQSTVVLLPPEFIAMCEADGVSPGEVLNGFLADLCGLDGSHGSDERDLAQRYYDRCYPYRPDTPPISPSTYY